jgi:UDP-N-acetylmuramoylalanine--D-glutamate ligase
MSNDYQNRRALVVGLGRSGLAACALLRSKGASVLANDARTRASLDTKTLATLASLTLEDEPVLGSHPSALVEDVDWIVLSPGVPLSLPLLVEARRRKIPIWSEIELGFRHLSGTVVAVTGTKGKSTTATLISDMLRAGGREARLVGNIGTPLTGALARATKETVFVVEASSFQLATIDSFRPDVAVLLDVTPDHLDWHPSFADYVGAKARIFENQRRGDWAVVYGANALTVDMASKGKSRKLFFDLDCLGEKYPHVHKEGPWIVRHENGETTPLASLDEFSAPGRHNQTNAMAASAAAALLGLSGDALEEAFEQFEGLPHALERVAEIGGVRFYNDSKATNIQSVRAALESFEEPIVLILGGRFKGGDFRDLRDIAAKRVKYVLAIGESRDKVSSALGDIISVELCDDLEGAVAKAHGRAVAGDVVLLSPAGSSFDMFVDYQERGNRFRQIVHTLARAAE